MLAWQAVGGGASLAQTNTTVQIQQNGTYGAILTTADGKPLYTFSADRGGAVSTIVRSDNSRQVTYNGQPLYTFARDTAAGQVNGEGVNAFGGTWHVARVSGAAAGGGGAPAAQGGSSGAAPRAMPATGRAGLLDQSSGAGWQHRAMLLAGTVLGLLVLGVARVAGSREHRL